MTIAHSPITLSLPPNSMTYDDYMAEGEINLRYDILDGVRIVTNPNRRRHQRISRKLLLLFAPYEAATGNGQSLAAPCDVLIRRTPLRTRQPDVLFMSRECVARNPPMDDPAPLDPAPELVVEIISPSDTSTVLTDKMADYQSLSVREMWLARPVLQTVEVLLLTPISAQSAATYNVGDIVQSVVFPGLFCAVADIFAEP